MPSPAEELAARLARIDTLVKELAAACKIADEQRPLIEKLELELAEARRGLKTILPPASFS